MSPNDRTVKLYAALTELDEDILLDALPPASARLPRGNRRRPDGRRPDSLLHSVGRFFERGWVVAALCLLVSSITLGGVIWLGNREPTRPAETVETESDQTVVGDSAPSLSLHITGSSGGSYLIQDEIFLGGTFYEKQETATSSAEETTAEPATFAYEGEALPDAAYLQAAAPTLLQTAVRTVFAEETLRVSAGRADLSALQVYDEAFVRVESADDAASLDRLPSGTYYVVVEVTAYRLPMELAGRGDTYQAKSARFAYVFALVKQDFWASYADFMPTALFATPSGEMRVEAVLRHHVILRTQNQDGTTVEHKQPYVTLESEAILAMKESFERHPITSLDMVTEFLTLEGLSGGRFHFASATVYDKDTGEFIVSGSISGLSAYIEDACYLLLRFGVSGDTHTIGDTVYEVENIYYEFPVYYILSQDYSNRMPKLLLGAGEQHILPMHRYLWRSYSASSVRTQAVTELAAYAAHLWASPITVSRDTPLTPLTVTLADPETSLKEVIIFDTDFGEVAAGADTSCINTLPTGDYYVVLAVNAEGHGQRNPMKSSTYCHLYFASLRVAAAGGGIAPGGGIDPNAPALLTVTCGAGGAAIREGDTFILSDNLRDEQFDPGVTHENAMQNVPAVLSEELRALAERRADTPIIMPQDGDPCLCIAKPFNAHWLYSIAIYDEDGRLVDGEASTVLLPLSDWEGVWGFTGRLGQLAPGRYYVVIKLDLPADPTEEAVTAYDYPFVLVRE